MEIQIPRPVYDKIMHWVNKSNDEVSGFGKVVHYPETGVFDVVDAFLLKQENGAAHTDINAASLSKLMFTTKDEPGELRWWWHSHVNMACFWSGTDTATIKELGAQGWIVATVFNKKEEMRSALGYKCHLVTQSAFGNTDKDEVLVQDELDTFIMPNHSDELIAAWDKEYDDNVQVKKWSGGWNPKDDEWEKCPETGAWRWLGGKKGSALTTFHQQSDKHNRTTGTGASEASWGGTTEETAIGREEEKFYKREGLFGYGLEAEAKVLGMSAKKYLKALVYSDDKQFNEISAKLELAQNTGILV